MSDSSSNASSDSTWIPYSERPEWSDVKPVEQDDGPVPVVQIAYSAKFRDVYGYFRAVMCSGEVSRRALDLTADALNLNPANYTVWYHRRFLVKELGIDIKEEFEFCRDIMEQQPKNYQVWQHRRILVEWSKDPSRELRLTEIVLSQDAKNYHAWQHRQWVVETFKLYDGELDYVVRLIEEDVRNNSAWNQRWFITRLTGGLAENLDREIDFTFRMIRLVPGNESAWNYLMGIVNNCEEKDKAGTTEKTWMFCEDLYEGGCRSVYLMSTMVDLGKTDAKNKARVEKSRQFCHDLATKYDTIRRRYWDYVKNTIVTT